MKNEPPNASSQEIRWAIEARKGLDVLDKMRAKLIDPAPGEVFEKYDLSDSTEEQVVANCLRYRDSGNAKVLFLTLNENAKQIAKSAGLELADFNIKKFRRKRKRELEVYLLEEIAQGKKVNPIHRFFRRMYVIYHDIKRIGKFTIYAILIFIIVMYAIAELL